MALFIFWLVITLPFAQSYPDGQVTESCGDMKPVHGSNAQTSTAPFSVSTSINGFTNGGVITVQLQSTSGSSPAFQGFLLEARAVGGSNPLGSFTLVSQGTRLLNCNGVSGSAVAHTSKSAKRSIQATWKAPSSGVLTKIEFLVTFVQAYGTFWVNVKSPGLIYTSTNSGLVTPATNNGPATPGTAQAFSNVTASSSVISATECGVTKACFSHPSNCDPAVSTSCYFMSSMAVPGQSGVFQFEMTGPTTGYVAMGFSDDQRMGNDDIYICGLSINGVPQLQHAYSTGTTTPPVIALGNVTDVKASMINGIISCSFTSANPISTQRSTASDNLSYFLQLVYGATSNGQIQIHSETYVSNAKVDLSNPQTVQDAGHPAIIKVHGALMLISWMTTGSLGMIIARYMKDMAKGSQLCGKDYWFLVHVGLMTLTVMATIIGFILGFVYAAGWADDAGSHPVLGVLVMILSFIQPFSALFRCGPQHHLRYIFNWAHALNAVVIKFLAVAAIFTGMQLFDVVGGWLVKVMGGFVAWELLFFIILDFQSRSKINEAMKSSTETKQTNWMTLVIYLLGNFAFLVALLVGIGQ